LFINILVTSNSERNVFGIERAKCAEIAAADLILSVLLKVIQGFISNNNTINKGQRCLNNLN